ncbi:MAG: PH domain-containing protein [Chloroflexales bacterium]|nr:PH domain-containing protein [Chloroflexales bacterium]
MPRAEKDPAKKRWQQRELENDIELSTGEELLFYTGRHWIVLLRLLLFPTLVALLAGAVAGFRARGGVFLLPNASGIGQIDLFNGIIGGLLLLLLLFLLTRRGKKRLGGGRTLLLGLALLALGALFFFRYQGGRVFAMNTYDAAPFDGFNIVLFVIAIAGVLWGIYNFLDWLADQLVLTTLRVIDDDEVPFVRHYQDQITLDDVQNVKAETKTYLQQWLKYGTVTIQSANAGGSIIFDFASRPMELQDAINKRLKEWRSQRSAEQFRQMIKTRVYGGAADKALPATHYRVTRPPFVLNWLLDNNPLYAPDGTVTWRPHWLFIVTALVRPVGALLLLLFATLVGAQAGWLNSGWLALLLFGAIVGFVAWAAWEIEDHKNDLYILTLTNVIDIDKRPFGPEDRRTAGLGAIQNVTFRTTFLSQLLGYGDVYLETAGSGGKFTFHRVPRAPEVVATVNEYLAAFKKGEKERNLNDTISLIKTYHQLMEPDSGNT